MANAPPQQSSPRNHRLGRAAARLLLLATSVVGALLLAEAAVRLFLPQYHPAFQSLLIRNGEGVTLGLPGSHRLSTPKGDFDTVVTFNPDGLRDSKRLADATVNDWFVLGDSYVLGWGVAESERFSSLLESQIGRPVFNLGIPEDLLGYERLLHYAEAKGAPVRRLILAVCMENDLWDYSSPVPSEQVFAEHMNPGLRGQTRLWLKQHSALYLASSYSIQRFPAARGFLERFGLARNVDQLTHKNKIGEGELHSSCGQLLKLAAHRDCVVLIIPSRALWAGADTAQEQRIHHRFVQRLREARLPVVDLKSRFEQSGNPLGYYFTSDAHWNRQGHKAAAAALAEFLRVGPRL